MQIWLIIAGMAVVTYLPRLLPLTTFNEELLPDWAKRALHYVPIAMLSAIAGGEFLPGEGWFDYRMDAHLPAGIAAIAVAWFTRNTMLTIAVGMGVLLFLT